jgi:hypothetical protein
MRIEEPVGWLLRVVRALRRLGGFDDQAWR